MAALKRIALYTGCLADGQIERDNGKFPFPLGTFHLAENGRGYDMNAAKSHFPIFSFLENEVSGLGFACGFVYPAMQKIIIVQ